MVISGITQHGLYFARMSFLHDDFIERLRARIAGMNHNLSPEADYGVEQVSWNDKLDEPLLKFAITAAAERIARKLTAWRCNLDINPQSIIFTFEFESDFSKFYTLIETQIREVIYRSIYADKLTLGTATLRGILLTLRDDARNRADSTLEDLTMTMSILEN